MCGIWGISDNNSGIERALLYKIMKEMMLLSETRGKDASGVAVMQSNRLNIIRKAKSSKELLKDSDFLYYAKKNILESNNKNIMMVGHSRLMTNGTQYIPNNNQPVAKKGLALVHNGIIVNEDSLWDKVGKENQEYDVDSEVILELISYYQKNDSMKWLNREKAIKEVCYL